MCVLTWCDFSEFVEYSVSLFCLLFHTVLQELFMEDGDKIKGLPLLLS